MKKVLVASSLLIAGAAHADVLGLSAEVGMFMPDADLTAMDHNSSASTSSDLNGDTVNYFGVALEHPIPLVPNIRIQKSDLTADGTATSSAFGGVSVSGDATLDLSHSDYTLYYQFLDGLAWLNLDAGLTLRAFDGSVKIGSQSSNLSVTVPMGYVTAYVNIPGLPLQVGGELKSLSIGDSSITDTTFKVKYQTPFLVGVEGGYRTSSIDLKDVAGLDVSSEFSGIFVGASVAF